MAMANYYSQKPTRYSMVGDDLTDAEVIAIVEKELKNVSATDLAKVALGDYSPLTDVVRNSVKQICVKGTVKQVSSYVPYILAVAVGLVILYFIVK